MYFFWNTTIGKKYKIFGLTFLQQNLKLQLISIATQRCK